MENKTDFFTKISPLLVGGLNLTVTIKKVGDQITVATRPQRPDVKDKNDVLSKIQPLVITETAEALDDGYIETITQAAEPVNSIADGLKEFNKSVDAAKAAAEKKPKKAASSSSPSKPKAKAKSSSKLTPEEKEAKLQKEAAAKKASEIKILEQKRTSATNLINGKRYKAAQPIALGGEKLWKAKKYQTVEGDIDYGVVFADLLKQAEAGFAEVVRTDGMRRAVAPMKAAKAYAASLNFAECGKNLKAVYKLVADHPEAIELTGTLVEKLGQATYDQLMSTKN